MNGVNVRRVTSLAAIWSVLLLPTVAATGKTQSQKPTDEDKCPVCGMFVMPHSQWLAEIVFEDGTAAFFDGSKDLFRYLLGRDRYLPAKHGLEIEAIFVTSYYELEMTAAEEAFYVVGSDVLGPMGPELVPHRSRGAAEEFLRDHRGDKIYRFEQVNAELLEELQ